nr:MAG TPA: hypothetical protein [Caudoviricetes sp.]
MGGYIKRRRGSFLAVTHVSFSDSNYFIDYQFFFPFGQGLLLCLCTFSVFFNSF